MSSDPAWTLSRGMHACIYVIDRFIENIILVDGK